VSYACSGGDQNWQRASRPPAEVSTPGSVNRMGVVAPLTSMAPPPLALKARRVTPLVSPPPPCGSKVVERNSVMTLAVTPSNSPDGSGWNAEAEPLTTSGAALRRAPPGGSTWMSVWMVGDTDTAGGGGTAVALSTFSRLTTWLTASVSSTPDTERSVAPPAVELDCATLDSALTMLPPAAPVALMLPDATTVSTVSTAEVEAGV
jgi:hypothetical protein